MNESQTDQRLDAVAVQLDRIERSVEATRKYFLWTLVITIVVLVLPLFGLFFAVPAMLSTYGAMGSF